MGEGKRRSTRDALYRVVPKGGSGPLWFLREGVLFLISYRNGEASIACIPASNRADPTEEQLRVFDQILKSNPSLTNSQGD
jgi:hypothetical protein